MPLLERLLSLHSAPIPFEDFFTEAVAALAEAQPELVVGWLRDAGVLVEGDGNELRVATQVRFRHPDGDSIVDLVLHAIGEDGEPGHVVFVESKVGSAEGEFQLRRYVQHLAEVRGGPCRTLVYATRDYDPKKSEDIVGSVDDVEFRPIRWASLHRYLLRHLDALAPAVGRTTLAHEIAHFMESQRMDRTRRFDPADALAFSRIRHVLRFMDEALHGGPADGSRLAPADRFAELVGGRNADRKSLRQIPEHNRYIVYQTFREDRFEVLLGFEAEDEGYPVLNLSLGALASTPSAEVIAEIGRKGEWAFWSGEPAQRWVSAARRVRFEDILGEEDHAAAAQRVFDGFLNDLSTVMGMYPHALPWDVPEALRDGDEV